MIKRLVREKGSGAIVITSDREVSKFAEKMDVAVIASDQFREKIQQSEFNVDKISEEEEGEGFKRKGPSRRLSKKDKRKKAALKKL